MGIQTIKQNLVYIGIAVLVFLLLLLIKPAHPFQPTGIILPISKQTLTPTTADVQIFQFMPFNATPLAYINLEGHSLTPTQDQENQMMTRAKDMAQQAGANALVVTAFGYEGAGSYNPAPLAKYVLHATAIKVQ